MGYVNHRPVFAVGPEQIRQAFEAMKRHEPGALPRDTLLTLLTLHGEKMTMTDLEGCLELLVGDSCVERALEDEVDAGDFANNVLGLTEVDDGLAIEEGAAAMLGTTAAEAGMGGMGRSEWNASSVAFSAADAPRSSSVVGPHGS